MSTNFIQYNLVNDIKYNSSKTNTPLNVVKEKEKHTSKKIIIMFVKRHEGWRQNFNRCYNSSAFVFTIYRLIFEDICLNSLTIFAFPAQWINNFSTLCTNIKVGWQHAFSIQIIFTCFKQVNFFSFTFS